VVAESTAAQSAVESRSLSSMVEGDRAVLCCCRRGGRHRHRVSFAWSTAQATTWKWRLEGWPGSGGRMTMDDGGG
jgi:hypothetical protein